MKSVSEVMAGLECCISLGVTECGDCPFNNPCEHGCVRRLQVDAHDTIESLVEENDSLRQKVVSIEAAARLLADALCGGTEEPPCNYNDYDDYVLKEGFCEKNCDRIGASKDYLECWKWLVSLKMREWRKTDADER